MLHVDECFLDLIYLTFTILLHKLLLSVTIHVYDNHVQCFGLFDVQITAVILNDKTKFTSLQPLYPESTFLS